MEIALVGIILKGLVYGSYTVAGGYGIKTAFRYVRDYRESIANEKAN